MTKHFEHRFTQLDGRARKVHSELDDITHEEESQVTVVPGKGSFNHREWLFQEARDIERQRIEMHSALSVGSAVGQ